MKYYLVEAYCPDLKFERADVIVALTPLASYELDRAGIKYSILEDYYDEAEFIKEEEVYFEEQLAWFDEFDKYLFNIFHKAKIDNLKLATSYYFYIKRMVDPLITRCKIIDFFINKAKPSSVIYISTNWNDDLISFSEHPLVFCKNQSLFSRITPLFCEKYNINFRRIILKEGIDSNNMRLGNENFPSRLKNSLKSNKPIRSLWFYYKTFYINNIFFKSFSNYSCNILFLKVNSFVNDIVKEIQKEGHRVFYKQSNKIIKKSFPYSKVVESIYPDIISNSKQDTTNYVKKIDKNKIISWIKNYCNVDITNIIMPRLQYFINEWCPEVISLIDKYAKFYDDNHIDVVFTPHMISVDEYAAIIATKYSIKTKSACLQHGDEVFVSKTWDFTEYSPYDIYFTTNYEREQHIKNRIQFRDFSTKVFQYSNRYKILPKVYNLKSRVRSKSGQKTLIFVPTIYQWDDKNWGEIMPDTWYYKWHKKLINYFNLRKDFNFIWKGIPASNKIYDPIPNLIDDRGYKNVKYATEPFIKWIKRADLVLLDYPSTALYEAAVSGLPVMSLFFAPFNVVRESALRLFGKSLQTFNNFNDGIARIDNFLNSNPDEFIVSIPYSKTSIADTLKSFKR